MERIRNLDKFQKAILLIIIAMILVFSVLYPVTINRTGILYRGEILVPSYEMGKTVYSGKIEGQGAAITISDDSVSFNIGGKEYGPYIVKKDPSALTDDMGDKSSMTGIEILCGGEVVFRGGAMNLGGFYWLYDSEGELSDTGTTVIRVTPDGSTTDISGNEIDPLKPTFSEVLYMLDEPELTHKGDFSIFIYGTIICLADVLLILFADVLFRFNMRFIIEDAENAEPSWWEYLRRYTLWTLLPVLALVMYIAGLR